MRLIRRLFAAAAAIALCATAAPAAAQVTTASIRGTVTDNNGRPLEGARVTATHVPSGTVYSAATRADGRFQIPGVRVGGPFTVAAARIGYERQQRTDVMTQLGVATDLAFRMGETTTQLQTVTVTSTQEGTISTARTGAATQVSRAALEQLPTISRRLEDFTRLTPQASGSSFAGADNRLNNITVDGSFFNNSFGLGGQPGDRTGVAPISLDAIEAVQVNIAPYDVRQGYFVGAAVNTVTKSGTNDLSGSLYYLGRNQDYVGTKAGDSPFDAGTFRFDQIGGRLGGPIIKNKLFFFTSFETDGLESPATNFRANRGEDITQAANAQVTRVRATSLDSLSNFLRTNFGYETGGFEGYQSETPSTRFLGKLDYNVNEANKLSLRYTFLNSSTDVLASLSSSLGFGGRRGNQNALNFQNTNYKVFENIRSIVGEWNSRIGNNMANNLIVGYTSQDESRGSAGNLFPLVEILEGGQPYTSFGTEPFTPSNELRYNSFQLQNNFTVFGDRHELTFGGALERYESQNVFFPGSQSVYVYNSLNDFYTDANDYLANRNRTTSPVNLRIFQVRYANIPGQTKPVQPLEVLFGGAYMQDRFTVTRNFTVTGGLRVDVPFFGETGFENPQANGLTFRDANGSPVQYRTEQLPNANLLWSPRLGFNWDVTGNQTTQFRGGTGIFTGRPAYVWVSNQIGNNGILTGFIDERSAPTNPLNARPFNPNPDHYKPAPTGAPASSYELALTDPDFRFPQVWRSNVAIDRRLPFGLIGTAEFLYSQDVNGVSYINANLSAPDGNFSGPDNRQRWSVDDCPTVSGTQQRVNCGITSAIVLQNQSKGYAWNVAGSLERGFSNGFFAKAAYSYGIAKNTVDPGSIAFGSWASNDIVNNPNVPTLGFSDNSLGHRFFVTTAFNRRLLPIGNTGVSVFFEGRTQGNTSYVVGGDLNGDGVNNNDLIYVPRDASEMNFLPITGTGGVVLFTAAQQQAAWEAYINQDEYLSSRRGRYTERGALFLPMVYRADLSFTQDLTALTRSRQNRLQFRVDVLNFTNLINNSWGIGQRVVNTSPLIAAGANAAGQPQYRFQRVGTNLLTETFARNAGIGDVWRLQFGFRYSLD